MSKVLIAYASASGSTAEIARDLGEQFDQADVRAVQEIDDVSEYDAVVVAAPMILGWHRHAASFAGQHAAALAGKPVAYCITCLALAHSNESEVDGIPCTIDPGLGKPPANPQKLSFRERMTSIGHYMESVRKPAPNVAPVSVGFFNGKLDYGTLNLFQRLFVQVIVRAQVGDFRNMDAIRAWAKGLPFNNH